MPFEATVACTLVSVAIIGVVVVLFRRDGAPLLTCLAAGLVPTVALHLAFGRTVGPVMLLGTAMLFYMLLRIRPAALSPWRACAGGLTAAVLAFGASRLLAGGSLGHALTPWVILTGLCAMLHAVVTGVLTAGMRRDGTAVWGCLGISIVAAVALGVTSRYGARFTVTAVVGLPLTAMFGYTFMRVRLLRFSRWAAFSGGVAAAGAAWAVGPSGVLPLFWFRPSPLNFLFGLIVVAGTALVVAGMAWLGRFVAGMGGGAAGEAQAHAEERRAVERMLTGGKLTPEQASELLRALGPTASSMRRETIGLVVRVAGALLVAAGFMLPWLRLHIGQARAWKTGYDVGAIGWVILVLGVLPAVVSMVPAIDRTVRAGFLRLLLSAVALAFAVGLLVQFGDHAGEGLVLVLLGVSAQFLRGLGDAVMRPAVTRRANVAF